MSTFFNPGRLRKSISGTSSEAMVLSSSPRTGTFPTFSPSTTPTRKAQLSNDFDVSEVGRSDLRTYSSAEDNRTGQSPSNRSVIDSPKRVAIPGRKQDLMKGDPENTGEIFSSSPSLASSLMHRLSLRLQRTESRDALNASSPPSPLSQLNSTDTETSSSSQSAERLENLLRKRPGFSQELVDMFLAAHIADATRRLRFVMAVLENQRTEDDKERRFKNRKICEIFLQKGSPFNILFDLPRTIEPPAPTQSSGRIERGLNAVKTYVIEQLAQLQEVQNVLAELYSDKKMSTLTDNETFDGSEDMRVTDAYADGEIFEFQQE